MVSFSALVAVVLAGAAPLLAAPLPLGTLQKYCDFSGLNQNILLADSRRVALRSTGLGGFSATQVKNAGQLHNENLNWFIMPSSHQGRYVVVPSNSGLDVIWRAGIDVEFGVDEGLTIHCQACDAIDDRGTECKIMKNDACATVTKNVASKSYAFSWEECVSDARSQLFNIEA